MLEWKTCIRGGVTVLLVYLLIHYWSGLSGIVRLAVSAAVPLILGCVIAYIVNILMSFYERYLHLISPSTALLWVSVWRQ